MGLAAPPESKAVDIPDAFSRRFELGKFLGKGGYGDVWECRDKASKEHCACKVFKKAARRTTEEKAALQKEILILKALRGQHRGLVQLKEVIEGDGATLVVMEDCKGGDMFELLSKKGKLPEKSAKMVFKQLASALRFCHSNGIVHRDIKLENILLTRPADSLYDSSAPDCPAAALVQAKLADFGLSVVLEPGDTTSGHVGSRFYTAPEILQGKRYGRRVDIWSLGVVLCAMLTGRLPFTGKDHEDKDGLAKAILRGKVNFGSSLWEGVSEEARGMVRKMLEMEPRFRIKACELLAHPWLADPPAASAATALRQRRPGPQSMEVRPGLERGAESASRPHSSTSMLALDLMEPAVVARPPVLQPSSAGEGAVPAPAAPHSTNPQPAAQTTTPQAAPHSTNPQAAAQSTTPQAAAQPTTPQAAPQSPGTTQQAAAQSTTPQAGPKPTTPQAAAQSTTPQAAPQSTTPQAAPVTAKGPAGALLSPMKGLLNPTAKSPQSDKARGHSPLSHLPGKKQERRSAQDGSVSADDLHDRLHWQWNLFGWAH